VEKAISLSGELLRDRPHIIKSFVIITTCYCCRCCCRGRRRFRRWLWFIWFTFASCQTRDYKLVCSVAFVRKFLTFSWMILICSMSRYYQLHHLAHIFIITFAKEVT